MAKKAKNRPADGEFINPVKRHLKQPPLTGMPRGRNTKLDKYAELIGEWRDAINDATREIKGYRAAALKEMLAKKVSFWSHGGVDFIVTPGEPMLKIKTHKAGSSETGGGDEEETQDEGGSDTELYAEDAIDQEGVEA